MNTKFFFILVFLMIPLSASFAQEDTTLVLTEDTTQTDEIDSVKKQISDIISEVNKRYVELNDIHSEGDIKIKTPKVDETASIEINLRKKDDVWFKIDGPLGIDVAQAHFGRKQFIFLNDLNDEAVTGSSNIRNIGTLTKIRCTFDDLMNAFSGSVRIPKSKKDSIYMSEEGNSYVVSLKRGTITRRYWIDKTNYIVSKYNYLSKKGEILIQFEFSNFDTYGISNYAKKVEIRRPKQGEYFSLKFDSYLASQPNLNFTVSIPSDYKRKTWK